MWKEARSQLGMGSVTSQVLMIGGGSVDRFDLIMCLSNDEGPGT